MPTVSGAGRARVLEAAAGAAAPFRWVDVAGLASGFDRRVVRAVVNDELRRQRVESDGNGRVRLRPGAFEPALLSALGTFDVG